MPHLGGSPSPISNARKDFGARLEAVGALVGRARDWIGGSLSPIARRRNDFGRIHRRFGTVSGGTVHRAELLKSRPGRTADFRSFLRLPATFFVLTTGDPTGRSTPYPGVGPKHTRVMSSACECPAENSRISWRIARPTATGPPDDWATRLRRRWLLWES